MAVTLRDAAGEVIAEGTRPVAGAPVPANFFIPLPAETAADRPGPWTVSITFEEGPEVEVQTVAAGEPRLVVVRPVDDGLKLVDVAAGLTMYERTGALPRIRWAADTQVVSDSGSRLTVVAHGTYPADTVVLSKAGESADGLPAEVQVLEDSGDTIRVRVQAQGAGYLVVGDAIQSDWSATVDGVPAGIVDADHALGAVYVEAGRHDVEFAYTPRGRSLGTAVSVTNAAILLLAAIPVSYWGRARRRLTTLRLRDDPPAGRGGRSGPAPERLFLDGGRAGHTRRCAVEHSEPADRSESNSRPTGRGGHCGRVPSHRRCHLADR